MMSRTKLNLLVDTLSFVILLGLLATGWVIKFILPPGSGGLGRLGHGGYGQGRHIQELWSLTRHEWGSVHFCLAVGFAALMLVHIILHTAWIKCAFKSLFSVKHS